MQRFRPEGIWRGGDYSRQRRESGTLQAGRKLVERLVQALSHAQHELQLVNGCHASDTPETSLPAELREQFWRLDARATLDAVREALDEAAAAAGFDPGTLRMPKPR